MTWVLILLSWLVIWRLCAHYYTARGVQASNQMATSGSQPVPAARSAQPAAPVDLYAQTRSEAIQGLVGLGYNRAYCAEPVLAAQIELTKWGTPITTEALLRTVLSKRAPQVSQMA